MGFLGAYVLLGLAMLLASAHPLGAYGLTYWALDYQLGFVKRALVGQVAEALFGDLANTERFIDVAAFCLAAAAVLAYSALAAAATARHRSTEALGFALLGLLSGQVVAQFGYDLGRFDQMGFIASGAVLLLMLRTLHPLALLAGGALLAVAVLTHEVAAVAEAPLLVTLAWVELGRRGGRRWGLAGLVAPLLLAAAAVYVFGAGEAPPDLACRHYAASTDFQPECRVFHTLARPLGEAVAWTATFVADPANGYRGTALVMLLILAAWLTLFTSVLRAVAVPGYWLAALACNTPLALCLVGIDYYRWLHLAVTNGILLLLYIGAAHADDPFRAAAERFRGALTAALCLVLIASYVPGSAVENPRRPAGFEQVFRR